MTPVAIFRRDLLPWSETFVVAQAEGLRRYRPYYLGLGRVSGLELPEARTWVVGDRSPGGVAAQLRFQATGRSRRLESALEAVRPALVHAHFEGGGIAALPLARAAGVPLVVTFHGFDVFVDDRARWRDPVRRRLYLARRRRLRESGALFLAVSEHVARGLVRRGYPPERIVVHYIGVDTSRLRPVPLERRGTSVLFVGRLVEKKGLEHLVQAMAQLQSRFPAAALVVAGDGPLRPGLERQAISTLGRCTFLGAVPAAEVARLMETARVLCVPGRRASNGDEEGLPMVVVEAQASGLPVVAFPHGGVSEAVDDGDSGLLVRAGDVSGLADALVRVLADDVLWGRLHVGGRRRVERRFDLERQTERLETIYDDAIGRATPTSRPATQQPRPASRTSESTSLPPAP